MDWLKETKLFSALEQLVGGVAYPSSGNDVAPSFSSSNQYATCQQQTEAYPAADDDYQDQDDQLSDGMSMRLLCITIKKARLQGTVDEFNSYVTVKLQNVKSTTVAVRGNLPCWEQEFIFETNRPDDGMVLELWAKGVLWDKLIGVHYMPLSDVKYSNAAGSGQWLQMDHELETRNGQTVGTRGPTGHNLLADVRFELPFDAQGCDDDIQSKLLALNGLIEHDQLNPNHHRAPFNHSGLSEDSDYTSDVSVPVNHHQLHPNSSAHQYESHLHPHRSRQQLLQHTREGAASYEDEEDAYHARNQLETDVYPDDHHLLHDDQYVHPHHSSSFYDEYGPSGSNQYPGYDQKSYEDTVTPVREFGDLSAVPTAQQKSSSANRRNQFDQVYGYASSSEERYDTPMSSGRVPRDEPILEHNEPEYVYDHNGYGDDENYGINPTYSEDQYDDHGGPNDYSTHQQQSSDFRNDYSSSNYQGEYWNESEPLSYNSRPPNGHVRTGTSGWREPGTSSSRPTSSNAWNYQDDTHQYDEVDRGSRHSFTRTPSVDRQDRRSDSGRGYYDDEDGRRPDSHHNWRYDSIQEEDAEKDNWKQHVEGYQEGQEGDSKDGAARPSPSKQSSPDGYPPGSKKEIHFEEPPSLVRQTIHEEEEKRNYQELWHNAYKRVCADLGIKVRLIF
ncbi:hypothetical protein L5515_001281 [Caenorhabditis briggsae]|uniref:C2 domain-containing protein n=2 Tax=Caenorhabditis briggsae TaxID=6238 RepID=A0AAE9E237_CAEBR|nr:hypothetical protein L5515_001281 [Caenorhabditis briggsae]